MKFINERLDSGLPGIKPGDYVNVIFDEESIEITSIAIFEKNKVRFKIKWDELGEISFNQEVFRSAGKAAAGAVIGGILTGGIGLIAGAAIGGKKRKENHLHFTALINAVETEIIFRPSRSVKQIYDEIVKLLNKHGVSAIKEEAPAQQPNLSTLSVPEQIEKLHGLLQAGAITDDEYIKQKERILK